MCPPMPRQDGIGNRVPTLCVVGCECLVKSSCVEVVCGHRWITLLSCTPPRLARYACSTHEASIDQLMFARSIIRAFASSTAPLRVQVRLRDRDRDPLEIHGVSRHCSGLAQPDSSCSRAPSTRRSSCSTLRFSRPRNPIPVSPPYVVKTPHLHGAPTTEETVKLCLILMPAIKHI